VAWPQALDLDHAAKSTLRDAAATSGGRVIRTRRLGVCERSNVIVTKTREPIRASSCCVTLA